MAVLYSIRRLDRDMLIALAGVIEHARRGRLYGSRRVGVERARLARLAEGLEVRAAAVVVIIVAGACGGAAEDGEELDEEEADGGEAGTG